MRSTILTGATLVDLAPLSVRQEDLVLTDGLIGSPSASFPTTSTVDASGCVVLPGLVVAHTHLYSALAAGMPAPSAPPASFRQILERVWWRLDRALDRETLRASALVGAIAAVRAGATAIIDHHESPSFIDGALDVVADALEEIGLRGVLCYGATDRHGAEDARRGLAESVRFARKSTREERVRGMIGLHAPFTCSDATLAQAAADAAALGAFLHLHAAEGPDDQAAAAERWGRPLLAHLDAIGLLHPRTLLAHAVQISGDEAALIAERGATVSHQPRSNMNNGVGYAAALAGLPKLALGTDGIDQDVLEELRAAFFRRREASGPASWPDPVRLLAGGHALLSAVLGARFGRLSPGAPADVVVYDYDSPTPLDASSFGAHLLFGGLSSARVRDVFIGGRPVLRNRRMVGVDEKAILAQARAAAPRLWSRMTPV